MMTTIKLMPNSQVPSELTVDLASLVSRKTTAGRKLNFNQFASQILGRAFTAEDKKALKVADKATKTDNWKQLDGGFNQYCRDFGQNEKHRMSLVTSRNNVEVVKSVEKELNDGRKQWTFVAEEARPEKAGKNSTDPYDAIRKTLMDSGLSIEAASAMVEDMRAQAQHAIQEAAVEAELEVESEVRP